MEKNLAKKISTGILATFLGMGIGYTDKAFCADEGIVVKNGWDSLNIFEIGVDQGISFYNIKLKNSNVSTGRLSKVSNGVYLFLELDVNNLENKILTINNLENENNNHIGIDDEGSTNISVISASNIDDNSNRTELSGYILNINDSNMEYQNQALSVSAVNNQIVPSTGYDKITTTNFNETHIKDSTLNFKDIKIYAAFNDNHKANKAGEKVSANNNITDIQSSEFISANNIKIYSGYCSKDGGGEGIGQANGNDLYISDSTFYSQNNELSGGYGFESNDNIVIINGSNKFTGETNIWCESRI